MKDFLKQNAGLIIVVLAIIAVWYFFLRKKKAESNYASKRKSFAATVLSEPQQSGYSCRWTNPSTGQVTTISGPCSSANANNDWITVFE